MRKRPIVSDTKPNKRPAQASATAESPCFSGSLDTARILRAPHSQEVLAELGERLRDGKLVSFPTETVYGLGANGLDARAVLKIFEAKGRPLSDPCILHVAKAEDALKLLDLDCDERAVFDSLTEACWPGPLSIVGRARPCVPPEVTASTGFVAVRCPNHPLARQLIDAAGVPLAAPSANRFGHISPTLPEHVLEDLQHWEGLRILDGGPCNIGIESTVAKLDLSSHRVIILRKGGATKDCLQAALAAGMSRVTTRPPVTVDYSEKLKEHAKEKNDDQKAQEAPGMMLRHYSPSVTTVLLSSAPNKVDGETLPFKMERSILVDFGQRLKSSHGQFLKTFDLCLQVEGSVETSSVEEACARAFAILREAESFAESHSACLICITDFDAPALGGYAEALHDRLFRAASGRKVAMCLHDTPSLVLISGDAL